MTDIYESRLRHFLEGLEMENIDDLMQKPPVYLKLVGSTMANRIKDLKLKLAFLPKPASATHDT